MANRPDELKALLMQALETQGGVILRVTGGERNRITAALSALSAARRELMVDVPQMLNVKILRVPGRDEIAIKILQDPGEGE